MSKVVLAFVAFCVSFAFALGYSLGHYMHFSKWATATVWSTAVVYLVGLLLRLR